jgi:ATP-binding cassette subfamily C protein CydC
MKPLLRILTLWRPRAGELGFGLLLSVAALLCAVVLMAASGATVAALLAGTALAAGVVLRVVGPARVLLRYAERLVTHGATFRALADLRITFFNGLAARAAGGLGFRQAGDLLSRMVNDVETLDGLYLRILLPLAGAAILVPVAAFASWQVSREAGIAVGVLLAISAFAMPALGARAAQRTSGDLAQANAGLRIAALDTLTGLREVRAYGAEAVMTGRVTTAGATLAGAQMGLARRVAWANVGALLCGQASLLAILLMILMHAGGPPAVSIAALFLVVAAIEPMAGLPRAGVLAANANAAAARVLDVATGAPAIAEPAQPKAVPRQPGLRFAGVHFAWSADTPAVFAGLTLEVPAGARVAVLGPSGAGKSTLAALALKIAIPQAGRVFLGGTDIAEMASADIHRSIAYLGQTTHLFDDTIRANLLLGRPAATERELWDALDRAAIGDTIRALPDQLDSWLGEGGARLSGGQGRRVALARTLLAQAPVLILDEPCAGLDAETERAFLTTLFAQTTGQTVILIAHRLTGAEKLDRIWRLSSGHAVAAAA